MKHLLKDVDNDQIQMCPPREKQEEPIGCSRCGRCCQAFPLNWSSQKIKANAGAARRGDYRFYFKDEEGRQEECPVNTMMAMWADHLESIPRPEDINVEDGVEVSLYWYRCRHCINVGEGEYSCAVYSNRPNTCANYKPSWMGGYLSDKRQIVYRECSYLQEWLGGEQLEVLQDKMVQLVKEVNSA